MTGLLKSHIRLKHEDERDQKAAHGIDFKDSFTSQSYIWIPRPDVSWLFMSFFLWSVNHCTNTPQVFFFFSFWYFCVSLTISGEGFCHSFNHPSTSLFSFVSFNLYTHTERQNISSLLSGCNDDLTECWLRGQIQTTNHKPDHPGGGGSTKTPQQGETRLLLENVCFYSADNQPIVRLLLDY